MKLVLGATDISDDDPCLGLYELNFKSPDQRSRHRYQIIMVIRNGDKPAEYRIDLGLASKFKGVDQFRIPGGVIDETGQIFIEETVGRLKDIANKMRQRPLFDKMDLAMSGVARKQNKTLIMA